MGLIPWYSRWYLPQMDKPGWWAWMTSPCEELSAMHLLAKSHSEAVMAIVAGQGFGPEMLVKFPWYL